jgi:hypothetical protein
MPTPVGSAADVLRLLAELGATPVGIGAHVALRYRLEPRETADIDVLVSSLTGVVEVLESLGLRFPRPCLSRSLDRRMGSCRAVAGDRVASDGERVTGSSYARRR